MGSYARASNPIAYDPVQLNRNQWIDAQMSTPTIGANNVSGFVVTSKSGGTDIAFTLADMTGIASISLVRAEVMDIAQAIVLQTWSASESAFAWSDTDALLQQMGQAFYWLKLEPVNTINGTEAIVGPQFILLNPSLLPPLPCNDISASHAAAVNGAVLITVNVDGILSGNSVKIYVSGYQANASFVAFAQHSTAPLQFTLEATGETITLKAIQVTSGGAEAASGPTCTLTLNSTATAPSKVEGVRVDQLSTGNQVSWPSSLEAGVTSYQLWRGDRGTSFGSASLLATIAATSVGTVLYLDGAGLAGDFQYFVIAVSSSGNSPASNPANPIFLYSSSQLPSNVPVNNLSAGFMDSIDAGSNVTVRIYGGGGVGTAWTRTAGYGTATRPAGSILGLAYATQYYILYSAGTYLALTTYSDTLPDNYEWVGVIFTCSVGGLVGTGATADGGVDGLGAINGIVIRNQGSGYTAAQFVFTGGGSGAGADAIIVGGAVTGFKNLAGGSGYSTGNCTVVGGSSIVPINTGTRFVSQGA